FPTDTVRRFRQTNLSMLSAVAPGVKHPIRASGTPHCRLAQSLLVERGRHAQFEHWVRSQLFPNDAVRRSRHSDPLTPRTIHSEIDHVESLPGANHVRICYAALIKTAARAWTKNGSVLGPLDAVIRARERNMKRLARFVPI